jgi:hypothetical protein
VISGLKTHRGEQGTSLVLALAFMTLFGVTAGLLATFGSVSFKTVASVREQRAVVYAAQGAVDTAIANVRRNGSYGGATCPTMTLPSVAGHTISATCTGEAGSSGAAAGINAPTQALLTVAAGPENGITLTQGAGRLGINGPIFSNSGISANPGILDAGSSSITARGACARAGNVVAASLNCDVGASGHPEGNDPNYAPALTTLPPRRTVPACAAGNRVVSMSPGFYDDVAGLSNLTSGGCANAVVWFQPGVYYFDFDLAGGANTWTVSDRSVNVVAGTPNGWSTTAPSRPAIPAPGGCKGDSDPAPNAGVQFVFGDDSHLLVSGGVVELCADPSTNTQQISLYGLKTGATSSVTTVLAPSPGGAGASSISGWSSPLNPSNAIDAIDNMVTSGTISGKNATASMTLGGYSAGSIPAGSAITSVQVRLAHQESTPSAVAALTATVNGTGASCAVNVAARATLGTDPLYPCAGITTLAQLANLKVVYAARLANTGSPSATLRLDGLELVVTYTPPALRAQSGCVTTVGGCTLVTVTSKFASFYSSGTIYAPLATFDFDLQNTTGLQVQRGMVARSITFRNPPATDPPVPSMSLPDTSRSIVFIGLVDGDRRVRAVVDFTDAPTIGTRSTVTSWSVGR